MYVLIINNIKNFYEQNKNLKNKIILKTLL